MNTVCALWGVVGLMIFLIVVISLIFCARIFKRHRDHKKRDIAMYQYNTSIPPEIKRAYDSLVERRYSTIQNYFIYQIVNKVFGFTGVLFSVFGFGLGWIDPPKGAEAELKALCAAVSFISIICVIIALYLSPTKRVAEYIDAWRRYDQKISELQGMLSAYKEPEDSCFKISIFSGKATFQFSKRAQKKQTAPEIADAVSKFVFETESDIASERE